MPLARDNLGSVIASLEGRGRGPLLSPLDTCQSSRDGSNRALPEKETQSPLLSAGLEP